MTEKIQKDCEECGDLFEPVGYEGILNATVSVSVATWCSVSSRNEVATETETELQLETERHCGTCEKALPDGTEGCDEHGVPHVWSSATEEWIPDVSVSVATSTATDAAQPVGVLCDECGETTTDYERITEENWEFCAGLQKQFCGTCRELREEPPCDDPECDADVCYDKREEEND